MSLWLVQEWIRDTLGRLVNKESSLEPFVVLPEPTEENRRKPLHPGFEPLEFSEDDMRNVNIERAHTFLAGILPEYKWESDDHLADTPARFAKLLQDMTSPEDFKFTTFETDLDEMIVVKDIPFYSLCAHHIVPFFGVAHVGYLPQGRMAGLSKIVRAVRGCAADLTAQEILTETVHGFIETNLHPLGVGVSLEARHLCMEMRGVRTPGSTTVTQKLSGPFKDKPEARAEFLGAIRNGKH